MAISQLNTGAVLYSNEDGSGLASLTKRRLDHFGIFFNNKETVSTIPFKEYYDTNLKDRVIDLIKIDIEGHELDALKSMEDLLYNIKAIQFEFGGCNIDTRTYFQDFWYFFIPKGFELYRITPFGIQRLNKYSESLEYFSTTNYIALNGRVN
jgi:hypothetical protein